MADWRRLIDERKLRQDMVLIWGEKDEHIVLFDKILHRMWAAEDRLEELGIITEE